MVLVNFSRVALQAITLCLSDEGIVALFLYLRKIEKITFVQFFNLVLMKDFCGPLVVIFMDNWVQETKARTPKKIQEIPPIKRRNDSIKL